jgi:hypothetical protein
MRRQLGIVGGFFIVLALGLLRPTPAHAEAFNLITSPLPINLAGAPGSTLTTQIKIKNNATFAQPLKVGLMKFGAFGEDGKPQLMDREAGDSYFDWVNFSPTSFNAPPGEWQSVNMTIRLPKTAAFGYYYAVTFTPAGPVAHGPKENVLIGSSAVLVLVDAQVPGTKRRLQLESFTTSRRMLEFLPATFAARLHNDGNIHVIPHGNIFIKQGKKIVATLDVNPQNGNILPNSNRIYQTDWHDGFPVYETKSQDGQPVTDKHGKIKRSLKWDLGQIQHLRFGHYTAQLVLAYDNGQRDIPLESTLSFWVVPWRILVVLLFAGIFILIGLQSTIRGLWRRFKKKP